MKNENILWIVGIVILALFIWKSVGNQTLFSTTNPCSPSSCPSGYTDNGITCNTNGKNYDCTRTCFRAGGCGSYGSWQSESMACLNKAMGVWCSTGTVAESSSSCYQYYTKATTTFGSNTNLKTSASNTWGTTTSSCSTTSPVTATTPTHDDGRGVAGTGHTGFGKWDSCGFALSSPGVSVYLYYKTASYTTEDTQYKFCSGSYDCAVNADCGTDGYTGSKFCSGNNVVQNWRIYTCSSNECDYSDSTRTISTCPDTCTNGACTTTCTPNWQCTAWSTCSGGTQTRTCTDANNCPNPTGKPAESQTCSQTCNTPADVNCNNIVERAELGAYAVKWINGQVTRQALGQAAMAWISGGGS